MNDNNIFIFEFVSGGGFNQIDIPPHLFSEAFGMLRGIIADFKIMNFQITTTLDYRIHSLSRYLKADQVFKIGKHDNYLTKFEKGMEECGLCFIIAPEFSNILHDLTKIAINKKKKILSVELNGIRVGTSKIETFNLFIKNKLPTPQTFLIPFKKNKLDKEFIIKNVAKVNFPIVIKPLDGVGAESIFYFEHYDYLNLFFQEYENYIEPGRNYILQKFIKGSNLSASLIGARKTERTDYRNFNIISINSQNIFLKDFEKESEYLGGITPANDHRIIIENLRDYIKNIDLDIDGYFGIDFIRTNQNKLHFIEINPRLTTSYLGVRNILEKNPAEMIYESKINNINYNNVKISFHSIFGRFDLKYIGEASKDNIYETIIPKILDKIPEIITPPISLTESTSIDKNVFSCFISTKTKTLDASKKRLNDIKDILRDYNFHGFECD